MTTRCVEIWYDRNSENVKVLNYMLNFNLIIQYLLQSSFADVELIII